MLPASTAAGGKLAGPDSGPAPPQTVRSPGCPGICKHLLGGAAQWCSRQTRNAARLAGCRSERGVFRTVLRKQLVLDQGALGQLALTVCLAHL